MSPHPIVVEMTRARTERGVTHTGRVPRGSLSAHAFRAAGVTP